MKKQPERTAKTRENLIAAFWQLYCLNRIEKITVKKITEKAGVHRSTFYEYFSDVYEILELIEDEILDDINEVWEAAFLMGDPDTVIEHFLNFYEKNGERLAVLLGPHGNQGFFIKMQEIALSKVYDVSDLDRNDLNVEIAITTLPAIITSLLQYWYAHRQTVSLREVLLTGSRFIKKGMLPTLKNLGLPF